MDHVIDFEKHLCAFGIFSQNQAQKDSGSTLDSMDQKEEKYTKKREKTNDSGQTLC